VRRIRLGLALAQRRADDPIRFPGTFSEISKLEDVAAMELDDEFQYNLACWFGLDFTLRQRQANGTVVRRMRSVRHGRRVVGALDFETELKMLRYLAYCLARSVSRDRAAARAKAAENDSDLTPIRAKIPRLYEALAAELQRDPDLRKQVHSGFTKSINRVLREHQLVDPSMIEPAK
jgi:hypothetical protein